VSIISTGKDVVKNEAEAVAALIDRIDDRFRAAVEVLLACRGRVIITGMGKSGIIASKIASTMTSTGTAAFFLHPAEGMHGDLGAVLKDDAVICISKSGNTEELLRIMPMFKRQGVPIIAIVGNMNSEIARRSDIVLDVSIQEEACPFNLVPSSSTTATLVMGDALALTLFQERGFSIEDFAMYHPGGNIGKNLLLKVDDVMRTGDDVPAVSEETVLPHAILTITSKRLGATCVLDSNGQLCGIITDGDLRRLLEQSHDVWHLKARDVMSRHPICVPAGILAAKAMNVMEDHSVNVLIVLDGDQKIAGMVHVHDLIKAGLA